jgi:hypothetical protein
VTITAAAAFTDLGNGLAGTFGVPALDGHGATLPGSPVSFTVSGALPQSIGLLGLGASTLYVPLLGGVLVPSPDVVVPFALDAIGAASVPATWPNVPPGTSLYLQAIVLDPAPIEGIAWTNGLRATARP